MDLLESPPVGNPFHPSFGVSPPLLVGRDAALAEFAQALDDGPGGAGRAVLYTGARGSGKTVMLNAVEDCARARGWLIVSETASPGFLARLTEQHLPNYLREFDPAAVRRRLTGFTGPLGSGAITWATVEPHVVRADLRGQLALLTDVLAEHGTGVLITLDEIHRKQLGELRELAVTVQHAFRESRQVAFAAAGLASAVSDVLNDDVLTFLRRAQRYPLATVSRPDLERGFREPIELAGRTVGDEALAAMAEGAAGYPFLLQLIGSAAWRVQPDTHEVSLDHALVAVERGRRELGRLVHEPALAAVSDGDRDFLLAMAHDDGPSKMADVQARLGVDVNFASQYRLRLIAAELIHPTRRGYVDFALPYLREHLRANG